MCGRIAQIDSAHDLAEQLEVHGEVHSVSSYNIAPGSRILSFRMNEESEKIWHSFAWGIRPSWMKGTRSVINARIETAAQKPLFKDALCRRRNVIPITAYYEWHSEGRQPYCIRRKDGGPLLLAGIYTGDACVILTRSAQRYLAKIHDRMPVILSAEGADLYLRRTHHMGYGNDAQLEAYAVTRRVGNPVFDRSACFDPIDHA